MYKILENAELLTFEEIRDKYDGKWVFMTNCEFSPGNKPIHAIPRVIADEELEGFHEGIYEIYSNKEKYGETTYFSFFDVGCIFWGVTFLPKGGATDEAYNISV